MEPQSAYTKTVNRAMSTREVDTTIIVQEAA
jgi:hypothetical protein